MLKNYRAFVNKEKLFDFQAIDAKTAMKKAKHIHASVTHVQGPSPRAGLKFSNDSEKVAK